MNILFVLPVLSDSYYRKRIEKLSEIDVHCTVLGFERDHYPGKTWAIPTESLGKIQHGRYFRRIGILIRSVFKIRKAAKNQDAIYAYNLDILWISWLATLFQPGNIKIVYDVADIRAILVEKGFVSSVLRTFERFLLKRTSIVVVASPAYVDGYFKSIQQADNTYFVIENKVDKDHLPDQTEFLQPGSKKETITIGYFGMLRCERSLQVLKELIANNNGRIRLLLRGIFLNTGNYEEEFKKLEYTHYGGPFVYPDDLGEMFGATDLIWGAHFQTKPNKKWAIVNRLYQACYFKRPLIVQAGSQNAKLVNRFNIGREIDLANPRQAIQDIQDISYTHIAEWQKNMKEMPEDVYTFTDEHERFIEILKLS